MTDGVGCRPCERCVAPSGSPLRAWWKLPHPHAHTISVMFSDTSFSLMCVSDTRVSLVPSSTGGPFGSASRSQSLSPYGSLDASAMWGLAVVASSLLSCAPRLEVQVLEAVLLAFAWKAAMRVGGSLAGAWVDTWSAEIRTRWLSRNLVAMRKQIPLNEKEAHRASCMALVIIAQHIAGATLCVPSILWPGAAWSAALACHGALSETGWEIQDLATRVHRIVLGGEEGRRRNPPALLAQVRDSSAARSTTRAPLPDGGACL